MTLIPKMRAEDARSLQTFWEEKDDPTRCVYWTDWVREFPQLRDEWAAYMRAQRAFDTFVKYVVNKAEEDES